MIKALRPVEPRGSAAPGASRVSRDPDARPASTGMMHLSGKTNKQTKLYVVVAANSANSNAGRLVEEKGLADVAPGADGTQVLDKHQEQQHKHDAAKGINGIDQEHHDQATEDAQDIRCARYSNGMMV